MNPPQVYTRVPHPEPPSHLPPHTIPKKKKCKKVKWLSEEASQIAEKRREVSSKGKKER